MGVEKTLHITISAIKTRSKVQARRVMETPKARARKRTYKFGHDNVWFDTHVTGFLKFCCNGANTSCCKTCKAVQRHCAQRKQACTANLRLTNLKWGVAGNCTQPQMAKKNCREQLVPARLAGRTYDPHCKQKNINAGIPCSNYPQGAGQPIPIWQRLVAVEKKLHILHISTWLLRWSKNLTNTSTAKQWK